jgi:predicted AlkP superfamily pyrophosphatase or phosphodiesterase
VKAIVVSIDGFAAFYWRDPAVRIPTLRALAARGAVAEGVEPVFPSTTWPTHVSLVTGVRPEAHGVVGNHVLNRATGAVEDLTGDPVYDAARILRAPTVYDLAHAAGRRTAAVDWPATRHAASLDFNLPFFKSQAVFEAHTDRAVWRELGALGFPLDRQGEWAQLPKRFLKDRMVGEVAAHAWRAHRPDLLLVHFLCVDSFQHLYGPRSPEAYWAIEYVDDRLRDLLASLPADDAEGTTVFVVSDHGFLPVEREIRPNVRLRRRGLLRADEGGRVTGGEARVVMNHGAAWVYLGGAGRDRLAADLAAELATLDGVAAVFRAKDYPALGLPVPDAHAQVGELLLEAAPGCFFADDAIGEEITTTPRYRGTHGQRGHHPDNRSFFLAAGPAIRRGVVLPVVSSRDAAPTVAAALGLRMDGVEGRPLAAALDV